MADPWDLRPHPHLNAPKLLAAIFLIICTDLTVRMTVETRTWPQSMTACLPELRPTILHYRRESTSLKMNKPLTRMEKAQEVKKKNAAERFRNVKSE